MTSLRNAGRFVLRALHLVGFIVSQALSVALLRLKIRGAAAFCFRLSLRQFLRMCGVTVRMKLSAAQRRHPRVINVANHDLATLDLFLGGGHIKVATVTTRRAFNALARFLPCFEESAANCEAACLEPDKAGKLKGFYFLKKRLEQGGQVFLFPSGTQKKRITERIEKGLFLLAKTPGAIIRPLYIVYDPVAVIAESEQNSWTGFLVSQFCNTGRNITVSISTGENIVTAEYPSDEALGARIAEIYQSNLYDAYDKPNH